MQNFIFKPKKIKNFSGFRIFLFMFHSRIEEKKRQELKKKNGASCLINVRERSNKKEGVLP